MGWANKPHAANRELVASRFLEIHLQEGFARIASSLLPEAERAGQPGQESIGSSLVLGVATVIGATLNRTGSFQFRATRIGKDTALAYATNPTNLALRLVEYNGKDTEAVVGDFSMGVRMVGLINSFAVYMTDPGGIVDAGKVGILRHLPNPVRVVEPPDAVEAAIPR